MQHVDNDADGGGGDDNDNSIQHIQSLQYLKHIHCMLGPVLSLYT